MNRRQSKSGPGVRHGTDPIMPPRRWRQNMPLAAAISAVLAGVPLASAQQAPGDTLEEVIVTAQKRSENLQDVPISIQALGTEKLDQLQVRSLDDYVKYLPSVADVRSQGQGGNGQPGTTHVYMRGVVSGGDGNHSGSQPSVGTYFDEQPVTTIDGALDVHVYDIARVEALSGPQGTLYGASSEAGTIRIITNKPDPAKFAAGYNVGVNSVAHGGIGYVTEGFVNFPLSPSAAIRLVAWDQHDAGYIDNVAGSNEAAGIKNGVRTFPTWDAFNGGTFAIDGATGTVGAGAINNAAYVKKDYNTADTKGGRGALRLELGDSWTVTPAFMGQKTTTKGFFGYDPTVGDLQIAHFGPENSTDSWTQSALTVEGKVYDFDVVYAGAYMKRGTHSIADYSDYSFFYDATGSGSGWVGNDGNPIMPQELVIGKDYYTKLSHELRISTPQDQPVKMTAGVFTQRQVHEIYQQYTMPGINGNGFADSISVPGWKNTIWLTDEERVDRDQAVFAQVTWDIDPHWSVTGGLRAYQTDNSIQGYYGYSAAYSSGLGQALCGPPGGALDPNYAPFHGAPCTNFDKRVKESGHIPRINLTYKFDNDRMLYATYSKGFRPGGVNRAKFPVTNEFVPPYRADFLINYEIGWKTQWLGHRVRWNGAIFREEWNDFQFAFLVPPSLTAIGNAGQGLIKGLESDFEWAVGSGLTLSANFTILDAKLTQDYCRGPCTPNTLQAPAGTRLPVAPRLKANAVVRYAFNLGDWDANAQGTFVYQDDTTPLLIVDQAQAAGTQPAYRLVNLSAGIERQGLSFELFVSNLFDNRAQLTRFAQCNPSVCLQPYVIPAQPRTIGFSFGQKF